MMVVVQSSGVTATEDLLLDALLARAASDIGVMERTQLQPKGRRVIAEGNAGGVRVRIGAIAVNENGGAVISLLVSQPGEFDALGGIGLVTAVLGSIRVSGQSSVSQSTPSNRIEPLSNQTVDLAKGRLPQLTRAIAVSDLVGEWKDAGSSITNWYSSQTGRYVGFDAIVRNEVTRAWH